MMEGERYRNSLITLYVRISLATSTDQVTQNWLATALKGYGNNCNVFLVSPWYHSLESFRSALYVCARQMAQAVQAQARDKTGVVPIAFKLLVLAN